MSLDVRQLRVADVPALAVCQGGLDRAYLTGTILYYHGFDETKEDSLAALITLAEAGFLAVGFDNVGHGERRLPDFEQRFAGLPPGPELESRFLMLVRATAQEVPTIVDHLVARRLASPERIGVAGWSMGGFVAYAAIVADRRVRAAASIVGAPEWRLPWPESPHRHPEHFFPAALLSQTAEMDQRVPAHFAKRFHQELAPYYLATPERLCYVEYPGIGHDVPAKTAVAMRRCMADWFRQHLQEDQAIR
jgi:dienelactone hydrolase